MHKALLPEAHVRIESLKNLSTLPEPERTCDDPVATYDDTSDMCMAPTRRLQSERRLTEEETPARWDVIGYGCVYRIYVSPGL